MNECFQRGHVGWPVPEYAHLLYNLDFSDVPLRIDCQSIESSAAYGGEAILRRDRGVGKICEDLPGFGVRMRSQMNDVFFTGSWIG